MDKLDEKFEDAADFTTEALLKASEESILARLNKRKGIKAEQFDPESRVLQAALRHKFDQKIVGQNRELVAQNQAMVEQNRDLVDSTKVIAEQNRSLMWATCIIAVANIIVAMSILFSG